MPGHLPPGEEELVAVPMGKRKRDGEQEYALAKRTCFDVWHAAARQKAYGSVPPGFIPVVSNVRHGGGAIEGSDGAEGVMVAQQGGGAISSITESDRGANSAMEAEEDSFVADALAALGDGALSVPAAGETSGAEYDGDQSGDEERSTTEESAGTPH